MSDMGVLYVTYGESTRKASTSTRQAFAYWKTECIPAWSRALLESLSFNIPAILSYSAQFVTLLKVTL